MELVNAKQVIKPEPDSHFQLRVCGCGSDNVAYVEYKDAVPWRVRCFDCEHELVHPDGVTRHGIQVAWNRGGRHGE